MRVLDKSLTPNNKYAEALNEFYIQLKERVAKMKTYQELAEDARETLQLFEYQDGALAIQAKMDLYKVMRLAESIKTKSTYVGSTIETVYTICHLYLKILITPAFTELENQIILDRDPLTDLPYTELQTKLDWILNFYKES